MGIGGVGSAGELMLACVSRLESLICSKFPSEIAQWVGWSFAHVLSTEQTRLLVFLRRKRHPLLVDLSILRCPATRL